MYYLVLFILGGYLEEEIFSWINDIDMSMEVLIFFMWRVFSFL